jgi:predicted RNA-binding Zn-ribbon protein involved in translation (DUF1610 family)
MPINESTITLASAITCGVSLLAFVILLRGRRIDDHPICRKCNFDLFGLPSTSHNCPECGADLNRKRAIRVGHRRIRKPALFLTLLLFLASASWLSLVGVLIVRHENWDQHKPVSWLMREVTTPATRDQALTEFMRRLAKRELSDNEIDALALLALDHQANRKDPWFPKWGQFIEAAHNWKLKPERWTQYIQGSLDRYELQLRAEVRRGQPIPFRVKLLPQRGGPSFLPTLRSSIPLFHVDGQVLHAFATTGSLDATKGPYEASVDLPSDNVMKLELGEHQAAVTINFGLYSAMRVNNALPPYLYQTRAQHTFYLIDESQPTASLHFDADLDAKVEAALTFTVTANRSDQILTVTVNNAGVPIDMAFQGHLSAGKLHRDLGFLIFPANNPNQVTIPLRDVLQSWDPSQVDVQLSPSLDAAEYTVDMYKIWGGQITRRGIAIAKSSVK